MQACVCTTANLESSLGDISHHVWTNSMMHSIGGGGRQQGTGQKAIKYELRSPVEPNHNTIVAWSFCVYMNSKDMPASMDTTRTASWDVLLSANV